MSAGDARHLELNLVPARYDDLPAILALERSGFPPAEQWSGRSWSGELVGPAARCCWLAPSRPSG